MNRSSFFALFLLGCGSSLSPSGNDASSDARPVDLPSNVCAVEHSGASADGDPVTICDQTFDALPLVRLPPDSSGAWYVALTSRLQAVDRTGKRFLLVDASGEPLSKGAVQMGDQVPQVGPPGLRMLSNRYLFMVYRVTGAITEAVDTSGSKVPALRVDDARPVVLISGKAIDSQLLGVWEGTASKRIDQSQFDEKDRVPVRVRFTSLQEGELISVWGYAPQKLADGKRFTAGGTIENFTTPARASDGSCLAALSALGAGNPFPDAALGVMRVPGMHGPGDDVVVIGDLMAGTYEFLSPAGLIRAQAPAPATAFAFYPHGTPNGFRLDLERKVGGGGGC